MKNVSIDELYSENSISHWRTVLGPGMHYHFGLFREHAGQFSDEEMDQALDRAVRVLYPHIPQGSRVLDLGCGWGGPCRLLSEELGCKVTGITISRAQAEYCQDLGLDVLHGDAEDPGTPFPERADIAFMMESLMHIADKDQLFRRLRNCTSKLVIRTHCSRVHQASVWAGTASIVTPDSMLDSLKQAGWNVDVCFDRRSESMPSIGVWNRRVERLDETALHGQLAMFREWCRRILDNPVAWARSHPFLEIVAT